MRRTRNRSSYIGLLAIMLLGLIGCGESDFDPRDALEKGLSIDRSGYYDLSVEMLVEVSGDEGGHVEYTMGVEGNGDISHVYDMEMSMSAPGLTMSVTSESWYDADTMYMRTVAMGNDSGWLSSPHGGSTAADIANLGDELPFDGTKLSVKSVDGRYEVSWPVDFTDVAGPLDNVAGGIASTAGIADMGNLSARAVFDKKTGRLVSICVQGDGSGKDGNMRLCVSVKETGGDKVLAIPEEVKPSGEAGGSTPNTHRQQSGWNQPFEDGHEPEVSWLDDLSDGEIDGIVAVIQENDVGFNLLEVSHENQTAVTYNSGSLDDWNATLNVYRHEDSGEAMEFFMDEYVQFSGYYGDPLESASDGDGISWAVFALEPDPEKGCYVIMMGRHGHLYMVCGGFDWKAASREEALANLLHMADATGMRWGRP